MGLFNKKRKSEVTEVDVYTEHGNEVHVFDGPDGKVEVSKVNMADFLPTGEQWCPHCHVQCEKRDDGKWFECPEYYCRGCRTVWQLSDGGIHLRLMITAEY